MSIEAKQKKRFRTVGMLRFCEAFAQSNPFCVGNFPHIAHFEHPGKNWFHFSQMRFSSTKIEKTANF